MARRTAALALALCCCRPGFALEPRKLLTQYSRASWTQSQGLPQNGIRAMTQTSDGYLWIGTREGLARFDGYRFTTFSREHGDLPSNTIYALAAGTQGGLWIGTPEGLTEYRDRRFRTYTKKEGLPDNLVLFLHATRSGALWIVGEDAVSRFENGRFTAWKVGPQIPMASVREISEDRNGHLLLAGDNAVARFDGARFSTELDANALRSFGVLSSAVLVDRSGEQWMLTSRGVLHRPVSGPLRLLGPPEGIPAQFSSSRGALLQDRDGSIWAGSAAGLARIENDHARLVPETSARILLEDREGNLWTAGDEGVVEFRDSSFTVFGRPEGFPSDQPSVVHQDRRGRVWVGFFDAGLAQFVNGRVIPRPDVTGRVYSIRETRSGDLLIGVNRGLVRFNDSGAKLFVPPDPSGREWVNDAIEDAAGRIWAGYSGGLAELTSQEFRSVVSRDQARSPVVTLAATADGAVWAGTYDKGLWRVLPNGETKLFTSGDGLGSDQIRALLPDAAGSLWIGTLDGGLIEYRDGKFTQYTVRQGLASDNISFIADDGESLWLSTTRGITRVTRAALQAGRGATTFGVPDGLRSAEGLQNVASGGARHADGSLWFATPRGIAVYGLSDYREPVTAPELHIESLDLDQRAVDIAFTAIHLSAPDHVRFWWKLEGLDTEWTDAGTLHRASFRNLSHGAYRFQVRARLPNGAESVATAAFEIPPRFFETWWFRLLVLLAAAALAWAVYAWRERQVRARYSLVINERTRLAREVHDTLAQGFVGIGSQLNVVDMCLPPDAAAARGAVDLARRMAGHSLTEARRSVMDLRGASLDRHDLAEALRAGAPLWSAGSGVSVEVEIAGDTGRIPEAVAHHLLRVAQESVANAVKHAKAGHVVVTLSVQPATLCLSVCDDGQGFHQETSFLSSKGHFGLMGMRERAVSLGGELQVDSAPGKGTRVILTVPL